MTDRLKAAREATRKMKEAGVKRRRMNPLEKSQAKPMDKTLAIAAKCFDCVGGDSDPGFKDRIRRLTPVPCMP